MSRLNLSIIAIVLSFWMASPAAYAGCVEGVGPNNERMPCMPDDWRPGGGDGGTVVYIPTPRSLSNDKIVAAKTYWDSGNWERAIALYREALALDPTNQTALDNISGAFVNWGTGLRARGDDAGAEWAFNKCIESGGRHATGGYSELGDLYRDRGNYDRAMNLYNQALALDPDNHLAFRAMNALRRQMESKARNRARQLLNAEIRQLERELEAAIDNGDFSLAVARARELLARNPDDLWARNMLGNALLELGQFDEAIAAYEQGLSVAGDDGTGNIKVLRDNLELAKKRKTNAARNAAFDRADSQSGTDRVAALEGLLDRYPEDKGRILIKISDAWRDLGRMDDYYRVLKTYVDGGEDGSHAFKVARSRLSSVYAEMANAALRREDPDAVLAAVRELRTIQKSSARLDQVEADALVDLGRPQEGIALLKASLSQYPDDPRLRSELAWHLFLYGDAGEARQYARQALEIEPGNKLAQEILDRIERYDGSISQFMNEKLFGTRLGERNRFIGRLVDGTRSLFDRNDSASPGATDSTEAARMTAPKANVPGAFGATEPPVPIVGTPMPANGFEVVKERMFAAAPEPVVRLTRSSVTAAQEIWQRAGIEGKAALRDTGLEWVATKLPKVQTIKSLTEKTASVYASYSTPVLAHYLRTMEGVQAGTRAQLGEGEAEKIAADFERQSREDARAIEKMATDLSKKSMEWGISGGILPNGDLPDEKVTVVGGGRATLSLGDKLTGYVEDVLRIGQLWTFNNDREAEKWSAAGSGKSK